MTIGLLSCAFGGKHCLTMSQRLHTAPLVLALCALLAACSKTEAPKPRVRPPPLVSVAKVTVRDVPLEARAPVDLRAIEQVELGSKVLGYLDAVLVDRGDRVKQGQTLAIVRPSDLPDQLSVARGQLAQVDAQLALARTNVERVKKLAPEGLVSSQDVDQANATLMAAEANRKAASAQVGALGTRLGETRIVSPIEGVVSLRRLDRGTLVGQVNTGAILTVVKDETLRVFVAVAERESTMLALGQKATVEVDALSGQRFEGKVVRLAPAYDQATRTLDAEVHLDNREHRLRPGMYGRASIVLGVHPSARVVNEAAVQLSDGKAHVFVLKGDKVERRPVKLGVDLGTELEIESGLSPEEEVVVAGLESLADGAKVRVSRGGDPYAGPPKPAASASSGGH